MDKINNVVLFEIINNLSLIDQIASDLQQIDHKFDIIFLSIQI